MDVPVLPRRSHLAHKGNFGRALIIGGSRGMAGAVALAGMAAIRSGAGLVTLGVPDTCLETVAGFDPNYMTVPLSHDKSGRLVTSSADNILDLAKNASSMALGPGLGRSEELVELVGRLYREYDGPMVVDADALNALAVGSPGNYRCQFPRIITPHIGEFRRLVDDPSLSVQDCRAKVGEFAKQHGLIVVLKGAASLVVDGVTRYENTTGNPGMATGGAGDVLTGAIAALVGHSKLSPMDAAIVGVYVHGLAGDYAAKAYGETSMSARDIKDMLAAAFRSHDRGPRMGFRA